MKEADVILIGMTKPTAYTGARTASELVSYTARVSNPANQQSFETAGKLLKYLVTNKHWSPFEMVHLVMQITTTRDISRQILRHRSFSFQEFSQRYAVSESFEVDREARLQDLKNRQNSIETDDVRLQEEFRMRQIKVLNQAKEVYNWALENNIAKEQARVVLPEGLTKTTLMMSGTLRSWLHYCGLRLRNGTQKEHVEIAMQCWEIIQFHFPEISAELDNPIYW